MSNITVTLKKESWENIFDSVRNTRMNAVGNFWTAIQTAETQVAHRVNDENVNKAFDMEE